MKKSHIAILSAAGLLLLTLLVFLVLGRIAIGSGSNLDVGSGRLREVNSEDLVTTQLELDGFAGILVEGAWAVHILQAEEFDIKIEHPDWIESSDLASVSAGMLILGGDEPFEGDDEGYSAWISMPSLALMQIDGAADADFRGFTLENLDIILDGAGRIKGMDSRSDGLNIILRGLGQIDLEDVSTGNAEVNIEGAGEVRLLMDGGILKGSIEGLGSIRYSGDVQEERVSVDGMGRVKRIR